MRPRLIHVLVASAIAVSSSFFMATAAQGAATTCTLDPVTHVASATVQATAASVGASAGDLFIDGADCGAVTDIETLVADMAQVRIFRLPQNPVGPGFTDEGDGSSEIELTLQSVRPGAQYSVSSTMAADNVAVGQDSGLGVINLNPTADGSSPDPDVTLDATPTIVLSGGEGDDELRGDGIGDGSSTPYEGRMRFGLGEGADTAVGGAGHDQIWLQDWRHDGRDSVSGGAGTDELHLKGYGFASSSITLDGRADDGVDCPGTDCERDDIASDIERIYGSRGNEFFGGRAGRQYIDGGYGDDVIFGYGGHDELVGNKGDDRLFGGGGADRLDGVVGSDMLHGGPGIDTATFEIHIFITERTRGIRVDLDGRPDDGTPIEHDNVFPDIEIVRGTRFHDVLIGAPGPQVLNGVGGDDVLRGRRGNDRLLGLAGDDTLDGGYGSDLCRQASGSGTKISCER